jgi:DNA-binding transcriptional LysR family regulator
MNINTFDLNLLKVFDALMVEQNVTRAGEKIGLAQSSMSNALSRLRYTFSDELFVRTPKAMLPTPKAMALKPLVLEILKNAQAMLEKDTAFNPKTAKGTVRISTSDNVKIMLAPAFANHLQENAPSVDLRFLSIDKNTVNSQLDNAETDIAVGTFKEKPKRFNSEMLYKDRFVCIARKGHPSLEKGMTMRFFSEIPHVLMTLKNDNAGFIDNYLIKQGLSRRVAITVDQFTVIPQIISTTDYISVCPESLITTMHIGDKCSIYDIPFSTPTWNVDMISSKNSETNPLINWIKQTAHTMMQIGM